MTAGETEQFYASFAEHPVVDSTGWPVSTAPGVGYGTYTIDRGTGQPRFVYDPIVRRTMPAHLLSLSPDLGADFLKYEAKGGSSGMCFGDSGGPVLMGDTVVAVNSFINGMCSSYAYGTRTDTPSSLAEIGAFL